MKTKLFLKLLGIQFLVIWFICGLPEVYNLLITAYNQHDDLFKLIWFPFYWLGLYIPLIVWIVYPVPLFLFVLIPAILFYYIGESNKYLKYIIILETVVLSGFFFYLNFDSYPIMSYFIFLALMYIIQYYKYKYSKKILANAYTRPFN